MNAHLEKPSTAAPPYLTSNQEHPAESMQKRSLQLFIVVGFIAGGCNSDQPEEIMPPSFRPPSIKSLADIDVADASYGNESIVIQGVVSPSSQGGWPGKNDDYEVHCFSFAAWRKPGEPVPNRELTILRPVPPNADYGEDFPEYTIHRIRVLLSKDKTRAIFEGSLPLESSDEELQAIAEEIQKPVIVSTKRFGDLVLDRSIDWFEGDAKWDNRPIRITFSVDEGEQKLTDQALQTAENLWVDQAMWNQRIQDYAIQELLELKNGTWLKDGEAELTAREFLARMTLTSVSIDSEGEFEFWYDDGELFGVTRFR